MQMEKFPERMHIDKKRKETEIETLIDVEIRRDQQTRNKEFCEIVEKPMRI